jgi:integrase
MATKPGNPQVAAQSPRGRVAARVLTESAIRTLEAGQSRTDGALPVGNGRLIVTCTKGRGRLRRTWTFRVRKADQNVEIVIGDYPAVSLDEARERATELMQQVRDGVDIRTSRPLARHQPQVAASPQPTDGASLAALLDSYIESLRRDGKASARDVRALFLRHVVEPWPDLVAMPAAQIEAPHVRDVLARMVHLGIRRQTNVLRAYLQAAYAHGAHSDLDPRRTDGEGSRFKLTGNPVSFVPRIAEYETIRDRVLTDAELISVWHGLDTLRPEVALTFRCAILLGGQRFRQLLRSTWHDYSTATRVLTLLDPKGRRKAPMPHLMPVSDRVALMLEQLRAFNGQGEFIFSASAGKAPIHTATLSIAFASIRASSRAATDIASTMQGRDLRRSIETRLQALGVEREVRAQLLSHGRTSGVQQRHYERHDYLTEKAEALSLLESHIFGLLTNPATKSAQGVAAVAKHTPAKAKNSVANSVARTWKEKTG